MAESEKAKFWVQVFTGLRKRGLESILIVCTTNPIEGWLLPASLGGNKDQRKFPSEVVGFTDRLPSHAKYP